MIFSLKHQTPSLAQGCWVAPNATLIGNVHVHPDASIWFGAVLRADNDLITIGRSSNVQDGVIIHTDPGFPCAVGQQCVIGHRAVLHGCSVGDGSLIGIGAILLNGASVPEGCLIGAGALVPEGKKLEPNCLYLGVPARKVRALSQAERQAIVDNALGYQKRAARYREQMRPMDGSGSA